MTKLSILGRNHEDSEVFRDYNFPKVAVKRSHAALELIQVFDDLVKFQILKISFTDTLWTEMMTHRARE